MDPEALSSCGEGNQALAMCPHSGQQLDLAREAGLALAKGSSPQHSLKAARGSQPGLRLGIGTCFPLPLPGPLHHNPGHPWQSPPVCL